MPCTLMMMMMQGGGAWGQMVNVSKQHRHKQHVRTMVDVVRQVTIHNLHICTHHITRGHQRQQLTHPSGEQDTAPLEKRLMTRLYRNADNCNNMAQLEARQNLMQAQHNA